MVAFTRQTERQEELRYVKVYIGYRVDYITGEAARRFEQAWFNCASHWFDLIVDGQYHSYNKRAIQKIEMHGLRTVRTLDVHRI